MYSLSILLLHLQSAELLSYNGKMPILQQFSVSYGSILFFENDLTQWIREYLHLQAVTIFYFRRAMCPYTELKLDLTNHWYCSIVRNLFFCMTAKWDLYAFRNFLNDHEDICTWALPCKQGLFNTILSTTKKPTTKKLSFIKLTLTTPAINQLSKPVNGCLSLFHSFEWQCYSFNCANYLQKK